MGGAANVVKILVGKVERKKFVGTPRSRHANIIAFFSKVSHAVWIHLARDRGQWWAVVNTVVNIRVPYKGIS
jgi:hypothetical protein